jgi:hypothetical protein
MKHLQQRGTSQSKHRAGAGEKGPKNMKINRPGPLCALLGRLDSQAARQLPAHRTDGAR